MIGAVSGQQPRLERNERRRRRRADDGSEGDAGIGVETARHVERKNGDSARICARYPLSINALGGSLETDAEETVDDEAEVAASRPFGKRFSARRAPSVERGSGFAGKTLGVARKDDHDLEEPGRQPSGENDCVPA